MYLTDLLAKVIRNQYSTMAVEYTRLEVETDLVDEIEEVLANHGYVKGGSNGEEWIKPDQPHS